MTINPHITTSFHAEYSYPTAFSGWGEEEQEAIARVIKSGRFTMASEVEALEHEFAAYHGMKHGIAVNSGSSANLIAIAALFEGGSPLMRGDAAIVPALAWPTTYSPLIQYGITPVLCDCDESWNADTSQVFARVLDDVNLVVACSILGNPTDEQYWADVANVLGAYLIIDNCESVGALTEDGKLTGTLGLGNTFSFFWSHQLSAIEGGMILTDSDDYAAACKMLRNHGWSRGVRTPRTFAEEYDFRLFGYNVRPVEMHAAIAREQLKKLPVRKAARKKNYAFWLKETEGLPLEHPQWRGDSSLFGIHFAVKSESVRNAVVRALREAGIDCRPPVGGSFLRHPYAAPYRDQQTPVADSLHDRGLFLGLAPFEHFEQIARAVEVLRRVL